MTDTIELSHWINGEKVPTERPSESLNPSDTRDLVARTPDGGVEEVNAAVAAAKAAFPAWAEASPEVRSDILDRAGTLVMERREDLGRLLSREEGKTLPEGIGETVRAGRSISPARPCACMARTSPRCARAWRFRPIASLSACSA